MFAEHSHTRVTSVNKRLICQMPASASLSKVNRKFCITIHSLTIKVLGACAYQYDSIMQRLNRSLVRCSIAVGYDNGSRFYTAVSREAIRLFTASVHCLF